MNTSRFFLLSVIVTLCLAALMGLAAVLSMHVNWRLVATDLSVTVASLTCLAAALVRHRDKIWRWATPATYFASVFGLGVTLVLIWGDLPWRAEESLGKTMGVCIVWALGLSAAAHLATTCFRGGLAWVRRVVIGLVFVLAVQSSAAIVFEIDSDLGGRLLAANVILTSLGLVVLPILQRLYGVKSPTDPVSTRLEIEAICPRCSHKHMIPSGDSTCPVCALRFRLEIEEPKCARCGYLLYRLPGNRCPECGEAFAPEQATGVEG